MLTEIFTGHALVLSRIDAVSDVMVEKNFQNHGATMRRTMYLEIFLAGGTTLRHNHYLQQTYAHHQDEKEKEAWEKAHHDLKEKRQQLLAQWAEKLNTLIVPTINSSTDSLPETQL